jgi:YD repeat-containing protein
MRCTRRFPNRLIRWTSLFVGFALVLPMLLGAPSATAKGPHPVKSSERSLKPTAQQSENRRQPAPKDGGKRVDPIPPQRGAPAANLPNINELKTRRPVAPRAPEPVPSTMRSRRKSVEVQRGKKPNLANLGQAPGAVASALARNRTGARSGSSVDRVPVRSHHTRRSEPSALAGSLEPQGCADLYGTLIWNATDGHLGHLTGHGERTEWVVTTGSDAASFMSFGPYDSSFGQGSHFARFRLMVSNIQGNDVVATLDVAVNGGTVVQSRQIYRNEFAAANQWQTFTLDFNNSCYNVLEARIFWNGTVNMRFADLTIGASVAPSAALSLARLDPFNQSGNQLLARDAEWSLPLLSLPGRAGHDLGLGLSYSSLVWTRSDPYMYFDADNGSPSPGFRLGFPTIEEPFFDVVTGTYSRLLVTSAGRRIELRQVSTNVYEAADSSYLQLIDVSAQGLLVLRTTDGTSMAYYKYGTEWHCVQIEDRNGNLIGINNNSLGDINTITDTLGRVINFNYDAYANLNSISQTWNGTAHTWATFSWTTKTVQSNFNSSLIRVDNGEVMPLNGETIPVLDWVGLADGSKYAFDHNSAGQVISIFKSSGVELSRTYYDYDGATDDCPRLYQTRLWAENWNGDVDGQYAANEEARTSFNVESSTVHVMTTPDGTQYKETYGTSWQRGLVTHTEVWGKNNPDNQAEPLIRQKWTDTAWTQDDTSVGYQTNPRVTQTDIDDAGGNHRRTTISYDHLNYAQYGLPYLVTEYNASNVPLRYTYTDYDLDQTYLDHRIIGLVKWVHVSDGASWQSKTTYEYDQNSLNPQAADATMHDANNYPASMTTRGNLTSVWRWDVTDIGNADKALKTSMTYNAAGSVLSTTDPAQHTSSLSYTDNFAPDGHSQNTFAYPSSITDADGNSTVRQYNYDFGAETVMIGPPPANQPNGDIQIFSYDDAARLQRATTLNTGAYTDYTYGPNYVVRWRSVNTPGDNPSLTLFDGLGRTIAFFTTHPGSTTGYLLQNTHYDVMGRVSAVSNPTEVSGADWTPAGDDAAGWVYTTQSYDWKGRPLDTIHETDGTVKYASYSGCGCAGGEVVTLTDEVGRQQKVYSDVLGRQWKTEVLNWPDENGNRSVYSTSVNVFNARDQVKVVNQYSGAASSEASSTNEAASCPDGSCQKTTMSYDGYGRLQSKHVPEQQDPNGNPTYSTWVYKPDDTIESVTDGRGASATYIYNNNRHLVNEIHYSAPSGITPTANVTFGYDAAGNRTSMTDGLGSQSYGYDSLSQLTSETRTFDGVGTFTLGYDYNLAGELKKITDSTNMTINYGYDSTGRVSSITGADNLYAGVSNYASNFQYRAWGGLKAMTDGTGHVSSLSYNARLQPSQFDISGNVVHQNYDYYNDGRISFVHNTTDANFDRFYSYDHAGRLAVATSGGQARNSSGDTPYSESFGYDAFSSLTTRQSDQWNGYFSDSDSASYANNRRSGWGYDADGRNTTIDTRSYAFDAVGQMKSMTAQQLLFNGNHTTVTQAHDYDGDGAKTKESITQSGLTTTTYYLRSSVLRNSVIEEISSSGEKNVGYIYSPSGVELATQSGSAVTWKHNSPAGTGEYTFNTYNTAIGRTEFDPVGADISLTAPESSPPNEGDGDVGAGHLGGIMDARWSDFFNLDGGCMIDGVASSCGLAMGALNSGAAAQCPDNDCSLRGIYDNFLNQFVGIAHWDPNAQDAGIGVGGPNGYLPMGINFVGGTTVLTGWNNSDLRQAVYGVRVGSMDRLEMNHAAPQKTERPDLPDYIHNFYKTHQGTIDRCINRVFGQKADGTADVAAQVMARQTIANAPQLDYKLMTQSALQAYTETPNTAGMPSLYGALGHGTVYLASDLYPQMTQEQATRDFFHELGNILSGTVAKNAQGSPDYYAFGDPNGIGNQYKDKDTGARLEKCIFKTVPY